MAVKAFMHNKLSSGRKVIQRRRCRRRNSPVWGPVVGRRTQQCLTLSLSLSFFVDIAVVVFVVVWTTVLSSAIAVDPPRGGATRGWQGGGGGRQSPSVTLATFALPVAAAFGGKNYNVNKI